MNARRQRRILFREFLFRVVDRELLSSYSSGDASQLLLQLLTLLACVSVLFSLPAVFVDPGRHPQARLFFAWSAEHFLIATTMLTVAAFAVIGWGTLLPDRRDALVLGPLPVRAGTIVVAKLGAAGTALAITVVALHAATGITWPLRLTTASAPYSIPALTSEPALPPVDAAGLQPLLDRAFALAMQRGSLPAGAGVSIGVSTDGTRRVYSYGAARPDSLFHIASITKVFTGLALAHMIEEGLVQPGQPVRELIPGARLLRPGRDAQEITLIDLVTHHSGLPGMPADFRPHDPDNPYADFDVRRLYSFLAARGVARPPDVGFRYSNLGLGLLGHALATRAGVDYETLVRRLITQPLNLADTAVALTSDQRARLLQGYDREHQPVRLWDLDVLAGAGGLKSTAPDMLTFLEANLHPERLTGRLKSAIVRSQEPLARAGTDARIAYAWRVNAAGGIGHAGDSNGFSAEAIFNQSKDRAIVVLSNTALGTAVSADIITEHILARLDGTPPIAIADITIPGRSGVRDWVRPFAAYWLTMAAAALFVFASIVSVQGLATALVPRRYALQASSALQLLIFGVFIGTYFLQPLMVMPAALIEAQHGSIIGSPPSYWFLGLFQALSGSPALAPLAVRAAIGLSIAVVVAGGTSALAYMRTLRRMAEDPDGASVLHATQRWPSFGTPLSTSIVHFTMRTLLRSGPHRVIFTFYLAIGFALSAFFLKTPRATVDDSGLEGWDAMSLPLIVSSVVMMVCAIVGARLTFAMPREIRATWIFRVLPIRVGSSHTTARRRAFMVVAFGPVFAISACAFLTQWPWVPALKHLFVLALLGSILVELSLRSQAIPFTSSYIPGRTKSHLTAPFAVVMLLLLAVVGADVERRALEDNASYAAIAGVLMLVWSGVRWRSSWLAGVQLQFEDEPTDRMATLDVWDSRVPTHGTLPDNST